MSAKVIINSSSLDKKLAKMAILGQKGVEEATRDGAKRFISNAVRNTMPMILTTSPGTAKANWINRVTHHYNTHRITKKGWRKDAELKKLLASKKKKLGREASGWNAAAQELKATRIPAWVKRPGGAEGRCVIRHRGNFITITVTNSVPYNEDMTMRRALFALHKTERGFEGNLRALKRKIIREVQ